MNYVKIILASVLLAIMYGIIHDMITAHLCLEYFTIGHPKIIESTSPVLLALTWGVIATWWVGLPLGVLLAIVSQAGKRPVIPVSTVLKYALYLLLSMFLVAFIFGTIAGIAALKGNLVLFGTMAELIPKEQHARFLAAGWAHGASYLSGVIGIIVISRIIIKLRVQQQQQRN